MKAKSKKKGLSNNTTQNSKPICSCCGKRRTTYDHQSQRDFEFIPMWGFKVFFRYKLRRVNCQDCGVKVEQIPWAKTKNTLTKTYAHFLSHWAKKLLMNWLKAKKEYSSGIVEGLNRKVNLVTRKSYGFRSYDILKIALFHTMGNLPEPKATHSFF